MSLTERALWVIERHLDRPLTLDDIASACGASKYHLVRAFGASTGYSVMQYVRGRRLSAAAELLAHGTKDILRLALATGYGSHEAFSRAFRAQFARTPEAVRRNGTTEDLTMVKPMKAPQNDQADLASPRIVTGKPMLVVGLSKRQSWATQQDIPAQWQRFMAAYADIADKVGQSPIGLGANLDDDGNFDYLCGVEVSKFSKTPAGFTQLRIPAQTYAVFIHRDHIAKIGATHSAIWNKWLPENKKAAADGACLERHLETFDVRTGLGGVEIWVPLQVAS